MSSSYSLSKKIPSCKVDQTLLKELEKYIQQKVETLRGSEEKGKIKYELHIKESVGTETFNSIEEYDRAYFPNDTENVTIECRNSFKAGNLSITLKFTTNKIFADLDINFTGTSARETALSLADELLRRIEPFKTNNYLFNPFSIYGLIVIGIMFLSSFVLNNIQLIYEPYKKTIQIITIALIICGVCWLVLLFIKPYCTFKTTLNEKREAIVKWILLGLIGFILFTVIGVYFRQQLFGF